MPAILEPPKNVAPTRDRQPTFVHRIAVNVARLVVFVAIAVSLSGGWYLAKRGFGRQWRYRVVEELHKRGVEASIGRVTLKPFRGLVANNVRIFDYKNREKTLALISEVSLDVNYAALIHHEPFLNALDVRDAEITLPFKAAAGQTEKAQLTDFRAHVYFPPERIYVSQAEGIFCGVRSAHQTRELQAVPAVVTRGVARAVVDGATHRERAAKVQFPWGASFVAGKIRRRRCRTRGRASGSDVARRAVTTRQLRDEE